MVGDGDVGDDDGDSSSSCQLLSFHKKPHSTFYRWRHWLSEGRTRNQTISGDTHHGHTHVSTCFQSWDLSAIPFCPSPLPSTLKKKKKSVLWFWWFSRLFCQVYENRGGGEEDRITLILESTQVSYQTLFSYAGHSHQISLLLQCPKYQEFSGDP